MDWRRNEILPANLIDFDHYVFLHVSSAVWVLIALFSVFHLGLSNLPPTPNFQAQQYALNPQSLSRLGLSTLKIIMQVSSLTTK